MRRIIIAAALFLAAAGAHADLRGSWHASLREDGRLQFDLMRDHSHNGHSYAISEFSGLTGSTVSSTSAAPAKFALLRDAGNFSLDGVFSDGEGAGHFVFTPNNNFVAQVRAMGVSVDDDKDEEQLYSLASLDVSTAFIREMQSLGLKGSLSRYTTFRIHGVSPQFVREIRALGYDPDGDQFTTFRIHGVSPTFIREMKNAGYSNVSADQLVTFRIHGVSPEFVRAMHDLGYRDLSADRLVTFRIHGVSPEFVRSIADLGYRDVDADQLVSMRIHGVTPEYIKSLREAGYSGIPVEKLISMRIHGVDAEMVRKMK
jgi:hypothetical protein